MRKVVNTISAVCILISVAGCAGNQKRVEQEMKQHINCAHAEGTIRALQHEKAHTGDQIVAGVQAIVPACLVIGIVTGTVCTNVRVATGEYNKMIDERLAEIRRTCGIR